MSTDSRKDSGSGVRVPTGLHLQSRFFAATRGLWKRLAGLETSAVREEFESLTIDRPIYVTSLPRSGTTILTEMLEKHPLVTCHHYSDFPNVWTPYWRNYLLQKSRRQAPELKERAHKDRIMVSNDSPEAVEEVLWMNFFSSLHDPAGNNVLDGEERNSEFDTFYQEHILKLLAVRESTRYLAKGNYNVSRIRYILSLFPDARFLIPVRDPVHHIASLVKQQKLFTGASKEDSRIPLQLALSGHFEFGPDRILVNFGNKQANEAISAAWGRGSEVEGWARYWAETYRHIYQQLEQYPDVRKAVSLFRYEDFCNHSAAVVKRIMLHCGLEESGFEQARDEFIKQLSPPQYYQPDFSANELEQIGLHCGPVNDALSAYCDFPV